MGALARALAWIFNFVIWVPLLFIGVLLSPFALLYKLLLCLLAWFSFIPKGKDVLLIQDDPQNPGDYFPRLVELTDGRAIVLTFAARREWPRWSLPTKLFWQFGPIGMPVIFTSHSLPAVMVLRRFRFPRNFTFGQVSKDREANLEQLTATLREPRP